MLTDLKNPTGLKNMAQEDAYDLPVNKMRGRADLPYPEIYMKQKDPRYIKMLLDLYAGREGEFTRCCEYIYQIVLTAAGHLDIKEGLDGISRTEMRHLFMLGDIISQLGGDPRLWSVENNRNKMWDGNFVRYTKNIKRMLLSDIESKMAAIRNYRAAMGAIEDEDITYILQRILLDEKIHLQTLTGLYEKYK